MRWNERVHFGIKRDNAHAYGIGAIVLVWMVFQYYQRPNVNNACVVMTHCVAIK